MIDAAAPLVRRGRRNARYTAISNDLIDHPTLSPEARIVLIYLLSRPDNWELQIPDIRRLLGTGPKACGRNKTYEVIKELKNCAHVIAVEELRSGRFFASHITFSMSLTTTPMDLRKRCERGASMKTPGRTRAENHREIAHLRRVPNFGTRLSHRIPKFGIPKIGTLERTERNKILILPLRPPSKLLATSMAGKEGISNFRKFGTSGRKRSVPTIVDMRSAFSSN